MTSLKRWKPRSPLSGPGGSGGGKKVPTGGQFLPAWGGGWTLRILPYCPLILHLALSLARPPTLALAPTLAPAFTFAPAHTLPLTLCLCLALALAGATPFWEHEDVGRRSAMPKGTATRPTRSWQSSVVSMSAAQRGPNGVTPK